MKAWVVRRPAPIDRDPLAFVELDEPRPGPGEVRIRVSTCGVCRTDLHLAEGDLPPHGTDVVPGHEVVGVVDAVGAGAERFRTGDRIGIAWLRRTCGRCRFCRRGDENLCLTPEFTGWDADGGYAEYAVVDERFAYLLPDRFDDEQAAPLLCAGIIGYRALAPRQRARGRATRDLRVRGVGPPRRPGRRRRGDQVYVMTRSARARVLAEELGAAWVGDTFDRPPEPLDAAITFAPAGEIVPAALSALDRGGTLAIAGIHLSDVPVLRYGDHLFQERQVRSVTANTRRDGEEFLRVAASIGIEVTTTAYPLESADTALRDLAHDAVTGAAVLRLPVAAAT